jgi:hypothetical protein
MENVKQIELDELEKLTKSLNLSTLDKSEILKRFEEERYKFFKFLQLIDQFDAEQIQPKFCSDMFKTIIETDTNDISSSNCSDEMDMDGFDIEI